MPLIVFGLNHNSAPLEVLGKVVIAENRLPEALGDFRAAVGADEAAILSTCNRCEIYSVPKDGEVGGDEAALADWLCAYRGVGRETVAGRCFTYRDKAAARHLMRVASSVDSMIVGEPQVLGQVKAAYRAAFDAGLSGPVLSRLFERAIEVAKKVRSETALGKHPVSYASAAIKTCERLFEDLPSKRILLIGAGEMIELTARHFKSRGAGKITVAGRAGGKARGLAAELGAEALDLGDLGAALHRYDVVISCTASTAPVVHKAEAEAALKRRKHKPVCMVDLALPRDVDPAVGKLPDVYLYTLEDLAGIVDENKQARLAAAAKAEAAIRIKADEYTEWADARKAADMIAELLAEADGIRADALEKSLKMLHAGKSPEEALDRLSTSLTAKLMHPALETLKRAAERGQVGLLSAVRSRLRAARKSQKPK